MRFFIVVGSIISCVGLIILATIATIESFTPPQSCDSVFGCSWFPYDLPLGIIAVLLVLPGYPVAALFSILRALSFRHGGKALGMLALSIMAPVIAFTALMNVATFGVDLSVHSHTPVAKEIAFMATFLCIGLTPLIALLYDPDRSAHDEGFEFSLKSV